MAERKDDDWTVGAYDLGTLHSGQQEQRRSERKHAVRPPDPGLLGWEHLTPYLSGAAPDDAYETKSELRKPAGRKKKKRRARVTNNIKRRSDRAKALR
jgi:hypothetical protein